MENVNDTKPEASPVDTPSTQAAVTGIPSNPVAKKAALKSAAKSRKPSTPALPTKRISHLKLGYTLAKSKASDAEIARQFTASFHSRGVKSATFIAKRIEIYMHIGRKKLAAELAAKKTSKSAS